MKITCTKCGKKFDAEKHLYICPKCNHYHSQVGASGRSREFIPAPNLIDKKSSTDDTSEFIKTVNGDQTVYTAVSEAKKKDEEDFVDFSGPGTFLKKLAVALCIIIGFIVFISNTLSDYDVWSDDDSWDSGWNDTYTEDIEVQYGEPMNFETFTVNVQKIGEPVIDGLKAEDGYKLVQINFETDSQYDYDSWDIATDVALELSNGEEWDYPQDIYYALYEDEIASNRYEAVELENAGLVAEAHFSGEHFCIFEIPEDVHDVELSITSFLADDEDAWSYTQDECFRMPIEL